MNRKMLAGIGAMLSVSACAGGYYGPGPGPGPIGYDAYYDDAYGPFYDGYWGAGDTFYYSTGPHRRYIADRGGHFVHDWHGGPGGPGGPRGPGGPGGPGNFHAVHGPGNFRGGAGYHGGGGGHHR